MKGIPANLSDLARPRAGKRMRASSYDRTGGNDDRLHLDAGQSAVLLDETGAGLITHIWVTLNAEAAGNQNHLRDVVIRMYWDGEPTPSVEAPVGDFFGMGHMRTRNFVAAPLQMSPEDGKGFNCWFPMPYGDGARIEVENQGPEHVVFYYYVDYEKYDALDEDLFRFHALWRRECPTQGVDDRAMSNRDFAFGGCNTTGDGNYVVLEAEGRGHYVGCHIDIHNLRESNQWDWPGEGDDMIFIDGEPWPPRLHGTGTEDYVNMAWCPQQEYSAPYHGIILGGKDNWKGQITYYRYHIQDPILFERSIKVTIEHGHDNHRSDDWTTTAYWYQAEPHAPREALPAAQDRMPIDEGRLLWGEA